MIEALTIAFGAVVGIVMALFALGLFRIVLVTILEEVELRERRKAAKKARDRARNRV